MSDLTSNETMQISSLTGAIEALKVVETYIQKLKKEIEAELKKKLEEIANDD
jgi:ATP phosphoribosyltransferase regulatory subunit HisZ